MKKYMKYILLVLVIIVGSVVFVNLNSKGTTQNTEKINDGILSDIERYLLMTKSQLIEELGDGYEEIETGAEGLIIAYYYKELGLTFSFSDDNEVVNVDCDKTVNINGARARMNFSQIQAVLGKRKIERYTVQTFESEEEEVYYEISYSIGNCLVYFRSFSEDGSDSEVFVVLNSQKIKSTPDSVNSKKEQIKYPIFSYEKYQDVRAEIAEIFKDEFEGIREMYSESINEVWVPIALVDLNNDGQDEVLAGLHHIYYTGSSGTMVMILLERINGKLEIKFNFGITGIVIEKDGTQKDLYIKDSSQPWKTIVIGKETWEWNGSTYKSDLEEVEEE